MAANPDFIYQPPMKPYLDIVYQDNDIVVLNKGSGLLSVPGRLAEHQDCLQNRVCKVLPSATIVHRLDMATSGLILMALNKPAHVAISRQFEQRQTQKSYLARVYGKVKEPSGEVDLPLICDWPNRPKQKVDHEHGKKSLTRYQVLSYQDNSTLVELIPVTGRSHQLRVHMLALGHPILGDRLYAHDKALTISPRLQLHARMLTVKHPVTGENLTFTREAPFS
ncbi:bifunctional tRNA pseudouridine(32) synthase/23S rRNA pseudouridine(746) synthase RluA [Thalassomonas haliotis]|uniref:Dual-specificity RNA pseudouridine synthase RluA n=1 Tax=Thalassomonas haliotis TaxID=485448 RepID=A0ABY7VF88_9GAMM|nr:bifunctional tRNA pseudouridine(32) synthase/23S rRNA pseudouridine(746) synthase RluA [Thalassomonas haliotis]WDE12379.1 bifunctional tRNA pseudouridine(32) synthase/23S rRNA pseudouridine(746) synthase RluA [Thalassomonas haliotis]